MLQAKFAIYSHGGNLVHVTWNHLYKHSFHLPKDAPLIGCQVVSEEKIFEIVNDGRTTNDGRKTTDSGAWLYYKLTCELSAQVSLKKVYPT